MEEVDSIIIHFLRQLNINIDEEIKNISQLPMEIIIESASSCLNTINPQLKVQATVPPGISHKMEVASHIASLCKELGYEKDVGYQTFLYHNEAELRSVFMFLIEKLPRDGKQTAKILSSNNKKEMLMQSIQAKINEELSRIWTPPCCNIKLNITNCQTITDSSLQQEVNAEYCENLLINYSMITDISKPKDSKQSVNLQSTNNIQNCNENSEKSLKELKEMVIILRQKLDTLESERYVMTVEETQKNKVNERMESDIINIENILSSIGITNINNCNAENIFDVLNKELKLLHSKSEELTSKKLLLKVKLDDLKTNTAFGELERNKLKNILTSLKKNALEMKEEYEKKDICKVQLQHNYETLKKGNKRSMYTKRIQEIISNVDKQNLEINKILEDTRQLQKEINNLEGQLDRCFSIADETLFRDAKRDDQAKKAYKLLALLHSECNTIISLVNDTGVVAREIVDLQDKIKTEAEKKVENNLQKIKLDLSEILEEKSK